VSPLSRALLAGLLLTAGAWAGCTDEAPPAARWWKGNTHTHTLWSDGDGAPEKVAAWYRERDYHFLVLSDHNVLSRGEKWFAVADNGRLTPARVEELRARFGADQVEVRATAAGGQEMRLCTLEELRGRFEAPGEFLFVEGEEITDSFESSNVHVNGINLAELVAPQGGASIAAAIQANFDAVTAQGARLGRPVLAHLNHPNFTWSMGWEDFAGLRGQAAFEVWNGHPGVRNVGDAAHPSTETMWDLANQRRTTELQQPPLLGFATDDSHHYFGAGMQAVSPGRAWIRVRATDLTAEALVEAMRRGDFYGSTGVELDDVAVGGGEYRVDVAAEAGVAYRTYFLGARRGGTAGEVLFETAADPAVYRFTGDELFVRAKVVADRPPANPSAPDEWASAWTQPVTAAAGAK